MEHALARLIAALALIAVPAGSMAERAQADTPHLDYIAKKLRYRSPGSENKVWAISNDNSFTEAWLLQTPNCWGETSCSTPPPGGQQFLNEITNVISSAEKSVDIAELWPAPERPFMLAIAKGLITAYQGTGWTPRVRVMIGIFPPFNLRLLGNPSRTWLNNLRGTMNDLGARNVPLNAQMAVMQTSTASWDHQKLLAVDGRVAIAGGMNYWEGDYLKSQPVSDVSMEVIGPAATDAMKFDDVLWGWACAKAKKTLQISVAFYSSDKKCSSTASTLAPAHVRAGIPLAVTGVPVMTVGRLGVGIGVPGEAGKESPRITPSIPSGNRCRRVAGKPDQRSGSDESQTNNDPAYEYANPAEDALRALIETARASIFISQQDLLSCLPKRWAATEAEFDGRLFKILADKVSFGLPITIVLSHGMSSGYNNGSTLRDVAVALRKAVSARPGVTDATARTLICRSVRLGYWRNAIGDKWSNGKAYRSHAKVVLVDSAAFYIGSQNLYPARLQELGFIVESPQAAGQLEQQYTFNAWNWTRDGAFIDPDQHICPSDF